ncbi:acetate--CoA ligase family protein [Nocardia paucivorans]|uniref:acetate--CoA ligase family protein n=1 Tax=Nocardia paucivorans TaxID=114259 RepID=UPI00031EB711|nr:acetate--CoA ligase family protein [Nocardia paucivorans]
MVEIFETPAAPSNHRTATDPRPSPTPRSENRDVLHRLLDPTAIAVIGASTDPAKRGYQIVRALRESGYPHPVYPVNPTAREILGLPVLPNAAALPPGVDIAVVAVPGTAVPDVLRECAAAGVAGAVVLANGFAEIGAQGTAPTEQLAAVIAETGIRVIGPNTSGMLNTVSGANLVGLSDVPRGPVSVIAQSGNMLLSLVQDARLSRGPGFHICIGLGNQADVAYHECLTALAEQPETTAVGVHAEGFTDGRAVLIAAARATTHVPVVMLRGGRSAAGRRSVRSHTGSIAAPDAVAAAVLRQAGVEPVTRSDELAVVTGALATLPPMRPRGGPAILSDGGGHAALAVDALAEYGLEPPTLGPDTTRALRELLGPNATVDGPVDVAGATDTDPAIFAAAAELLLRDENVGAILIIGLFGAYHRRFDSRLEAVENTTAERLLELSARYRTPVLVQSCYAAEPIANHDILRAGGIPVSTSIDQTVRIVAALDRRRTHLATVDARSTLELPPPAPPLPAIGPVAEPRARRFVEAAGIDTGRWVFAEGPEQVAAAVADFGCPCAVRVVSPHVVHKSEHGGVRLNVTAETARHVATTMTAEVTTAIPGARIDGFVVTPMYSGGIELLVGATNDATFGPVIAFGAGGTLVEALDDVVFRAAPCTELEVTEMIAETRVNRLLDGYRGRVPVDRTALTTLLVRVSALIAAHPEIDELDLNPVLADGSGIVPVDIRIIVKEQQA